MIVLVIAQCSGMSGLEIQCSYQF